MKTYIDIYWCTTVLWHEWQHHNYGAGAWGETTQNSRAWTNTYGMEIILATAIISHLNSQPPNTVIDKNDKIRALNDVIWESQHP